MPDDIKKISATKQFNRLFTGPLDPTMSWDSMADLKRYLLSPTCYINQILACRGKAYIVSDKDGEKVLTEIGTGGGGGSGGEVPDCNCDFTDIWKAVDEKADMVHRHDVSDINIIVDGESVILPGFHMGPEPPSDITKLWIDTTEKDLDLTINSKVLEEFRDSLSGMNKLILELRKEVAELSGHQCIPVPPPVEPDEDDNFFLLTEDGQYIITEDGFNIISEDYIEDDNFFLLTEDGQYIITEDGFNIISEDYIEDDTNDDNFILITEDGQYIITEDGFNIISEGFIDNVLLTESNDVLITELGEVLELDDIIEKSNKEVEDIIEKSNKEVEEEPLICEKCEDIKQEILDELVYKSDKIHRHEISDIDNFPNLDNMDIKVKYHIGTEPPEDPNLLWIDTTDGYVDQTIDITILDEMRAMLVTMQNKISNLNDEIEEIKENINNPAIPPTSQDNILTENGDYLITEDGYYLELDYDLSDGDYLITEDDYVLITEDGYYLELDMMLEKLITENEDCIITEKDEYVLA